MSQSEPLQQQFRRKGFNLDEDALAGAGAESDGKAHTSDRDHWNGAHDLSMLERGGLVSSFIESMLC